MVLNRWEYIKGCRIVEGKVIGMQHHSSFSVPLIEYSVDSTMVIRFYGESNMNLSTQSKVKVIYKIDNPNEAVAYNFIGFWLAPLIYTLLPFIILVSLVFSFLTKRQHFIIRFGKGVSFSRSEDKLKKLDDLTDVKKLEE